MDWPDADQGVYAISIAAEMCGLHPQTLRVYEREGLVEPDRSAGGTRLYSGHDVARLREIAALAGAGVNIAGMKRVFELQREIDRLRGLVDELTRATRATRAASRRTRRPRP
jgi:MerR family transcriptional regulator/heat shock protein HspR